MSEQEPEQERDRLISHILCHYPPISRMEKVMSPEEPDGDSSEVEAFLQARASWREPYDVRRLECPPAGSDDCTRRREVTE